MSKHKSYGVCEQCDGTGKQFSQYGEPPAEPGEDGKLVWDSKPCSDCNGKGTLETGEKPDPTANDLEAIKAFNELPSTVPNSTVAALIAEVEALRKRVLELEQRPDDNHWRSLQRNRDSWMRSTKAAEARVAEIKDEIQATEQMHRAWHDRTLAAEAINKELVGALEHCKNVIKEHLRKPAPNEKLSDLSGFMLGALEAASAALKKAKPTEATEGGP